MGSFDIASAMCGFAIALIGNCIVVYTVLVYFIVVLPRLEGFSTKFWTTGIFGVLLFSWLYRYLQLLRVEPGSPPCFEDAVAEALAIGAERPEPCKRCDRAKPAGTHHCSRCNRCVLNMDHHCSLTNTCVGLHNRHHFHWILVIQLLWLLFVLLVHGWQLLLAAKHLLHRDDLDWRRLPTHLVVTWLLALGLFVDMLILSCWHLYLSLTQQSTIDVWGRIFWGVAGAGGEECELPKKKS